ncbi:MAG TPA: DAK2 domain-containing protein [Clostridiales bacterium]|nr:DAK2 domain-containing protein [Clostridiales bacterium]
MINGIVLRDAIISGGNNITKQKTLIDDLNIFPVPDGDTGTNMSMTINSAAAKLKTCDNADAGQVAKVAAAAMLRGARGNSGVILSLLFRGFSKGLAGKAEVNGADLVDALSIGVTDAYDAVMKPTEGTILTVARLACEAGKVAAKDDTDVVAVWSTVCVAAQAALATTPELLHVLKKAGVVDAGGKGLCVIFDGMLSVIRDGNMIEIAQEPQTDLTDKENDFYKSAAAEFDDDITFTYCTEYIVGRDKENDRDPKKLRAYLEKIGDCVVVVDDDEIIKVHVHTETPGLALQEALKFGQLLTVKVENMKEQHRRAVEANENAQAQDVEAPEEQTEKYPFAEPVNEIGFVAVAVGEGLEGLFKDLGCTQMVNGGQSMNPSTEDIREAVLATGAKTVFVLPNNKNIIMAAEQVVPLVEDRKVVILPTRTIPQGLGAMLSYDPDLSPDGNKQLMLDAAADIGTGMVTFAARDSEFGSTRIKEGDIIALENGKLTLTEKTPAKAAFKLTKNMVKKDTSFITVIYGQETSKQDAQELHNQLQGKYGNIDITLVNGGQPIYYYIISVE